MKEHQYISVLYAMLLAIGIFFCIVGLIAIPVDTYIANDKDAITEVEPYSITEVNEDVREFHFRNIDWDENGNCLHFVSSHQEVKVEADGKVVFQRKAVNTLWGRTPGYSLEYIEIPGNTKDVNVTITACYPEVRDVDILFYQGYSVRMFQELIRKDGFSAVISLVNVCVGMLLFAFGVAMRKKSNIGAAMGYLGIFTILLGFWSLSENGIFAVLIESRAASSSISFISLAMIGIPFIMFVRHYLQTDDKYIHKILLALNIVDIVLIFQLQFLEIRDMKQTLWMTHIAMIGAVLYLPYSLVRMVCKHNVTRRFWVTVWSLVCMFPPLAYSLYLYYCGSHNVDSYGNVFIFVFVMFFAIDVSLTIMKDIDAGKKAAIYRELAEKDLLTGCYNRNAYRNDTYRWMDLKGVLLMTFDLNNLKQCNDTLGHAYGDQYITDSATILKKIFGKYGRVYRIGGDEFCIIIKDSSKCNVDKLLDTMIQEESIYNAKSPVIHLQIAYGYARYDENTDSNMEDIRARADELMYKNKKERKRKMMSIV